MAVEWESVYFWRKSTGIQNKEIQVKIKNARQYIIEAKFKIIFLIYLVTRIWELQYKTNEMQIKEYEAKINNKNVSFNINSR